MTTKTEAKTDATIATPKLAVLKASRSWSNESKGAGSDGCLADDSGRVLYHLYTPEDFLKAELIVEAVNNYDALKKQNEALIDACERAEHFLSWEFPHADGLSRKIIGELREALALAEKGE